jgi:hypothetical protein
LPLAAELKDKNLSSKELQTDQALARFSGVQRVRPRGETEIFSGASTRKYAALAKNPVSKLGIDTLVAGALWTDGKVIPNNDYDEHPEFEEIDNMIIDKLERDLSNLEYETWQNMQQTILASSMIYGFSVTEEVWESIQGEWVLKSLKGKPAFEFEINADETDELQSLYHSTTSTNLNPDKFIIATYPWLRDANFYGVSELEAIEHDINTLEELEKTFTIGSSSVLNRTVVHYQSVAGKDQDKIDAEQSAIETAIGAGGGVLHLPADEDGNDNLVKKNNFEVLEDRASEDGLESVRVQIGELIKRILRNFGIGDNLGQSTGETGSFAKSKTEFNVFIAKVQRAQNWLTDIINRQVLKRIIDFNFSSLPDKYKVPIWQYQEVEEDFLEVRSKTMVELLQAGVINVKEAREELDFPDIDPADLPRPEPKQGEEPSD